MHERIHLKAGAIGNGGPGETVAKLTQYVGARNAALGNFYD
ncbi:hypothetical protein [Phormidium sp. CCY1219]|nr:hypothetical protein [Phormidium sp. CCY1219]